MVDAKVSTRSRRRSLRVCSLIKILRKQKANKHECQGKQDEINWEKFRTKGIFLNILCMYILIRIGANCRKAMM